MLHENRFLDTFRGHRNGLLDFVSTKYLNYAWSLRTLCRRLGYFDIKYQDYDTDPNDLHRVFEEEMKGPGKLLGYRALHKTIREIHGLKVRRDLVYARWQKLSRWSSRKSWC